MNCSFCFTLLSLSPLLSHSPFPSSLVLLPLRAAWTGGLWQVVAVLCLLACRRLPTRLCVCVRVKSLRINVSVVHVCACALRHGCVGMWRGLSVHMLIFFVRKCLFVCVFVLICPAVTLCNRAGNRRGVQPEQVIKKNPCKMALLWPSVASSG